MNAKDLQIKFIKEYLKPTLKQYGYNTAAQTWWKNMGDFFIVIHLQNSQWNSKDEVKFCLNIGVALTVKLADKDKKKPSYFDLATELREEYYLIKARQNNNRPHRKGLGYQITDNTNFQDFVEDFRIDLEDNILVVLDGFKTLNDCVIFYEKNDPWSNYLRNRILEAGLEI